MASCGVIKPRWPAPANVVALSTTRCGGVSASPYDSFNLGMHVGDSPAAVQHNRTRLLASLAVPARLQWLDQIHSAKVVQASGDGSVPKADACWSRQPGVFCAVMTADCLPVLLCDKAGTVVGAAHAGWRSLCDGVLENTVAAMGEAAHNLQVWLGPAIGPAAFEVGAEVRQAFLQRAHSRQSVAACFDACGGNKYLANLYQLATVRLQALGVASIAGGNFCTFSDSARFFSYRRDGQTGRMVSVIGLQSDC